MMQSKYKFLLDRFDYKDIEEVFVSHNTRRGLGTGDDSRLYIYVDNETTLIYWRENRGYETTIFNGLHLEEPEMELVFKFLGINKELKWE